MLQPQIFCFKNQKEDNCFRYSVLRHLHNFQESYFTSRSETMKSPAPDAGMKMKFYYISEILMSFNWKLFCRLSCDDILFKVLLAGIKENVTTRGISSKIMKNFMCKTFLIYFNVSFRDFHFKERVNACRAIGMINVNYTLTNNDPQTYSTLQLFEFN